MRGLRPQAGCRSCRGADDYIRPTGAAWYGIFVFAREPARDDDPWTSDRNLSEFLLRACHDLKSSLRAVRAHAELLGMKGREPDKPGFEKHLGFIVDGARKIDLLVEGLASYSIALQIEESSFQSIRMDIPLRTALARLDGELRGQNAEVTSGELPRVRGNPDRLAQIFEILLRNAVRHRAERSPCVHITAESQTEEWLFAVRDNGPGIEPRWLERIFKPFERLHGKETEGVGLGLAICRAIVERHGGKLWAESTPGTGSTFFFSLPAVKH